MIPPRKAAHRGGFTLACLAGAVLFGAVACTETRPVDRPKPSGTALQLPDGGRFLTGYGFENAPAGFSLPDELEFSFIVDEVNVMIATIDTTTSSGAANATRSYHYLAMNLQAMGFTVTARSEAGLLFHDASGFQGAWECSAQQCALSLRAPGY